ncbi:hypothetical protein N7481_001477 [Penicillium waksmanii]|uniref:uncharacterized protein n=1 Tax=Penicillium waksmanii TaxID=69791 RepID=UPI002547F25D|nr:uncharacterized protein N7481_001477 [Penicillium waksmanii]KAJ6001068.1 hypothetical protein N7481_001477 [Penicillium waksmanii]
MSWQGNDENLARAVLTWAAFSLRPISLLEIQEIYDLAPMSIRELKNAIPRVCGEFVEIDTKFCVDLVHETAHHFLTEVRNHRLHLDHDHAHFEIFLRCMTTLNAIQRQSQVEKPAIGSFVSYAMASWHIHLGKMRNPTDERTFQSLLEFLCSQSVINWINLVALHGQLHLLVDASHGVIQYLQHLEKTRPGNFHDSEQQVRVGDVLQWTLDLENLVGHYGAILAQFPHAIYELIPPFCPRKSSIRKYADMDDKTGLRVMGLTNNQWTNLGAQFPVTRGENVREVICGGRFVIVTSAAMDGRFYVFDITTNRKLQEIEHGDPILATSLSHNGGSIAIYSPRQTKVWDVCQARYITETSNPLGSTVLDIGFSIDDKTLFVCLDNGMVRKLSLALFPQCWEHVIGPVKHSSESGIRRLPYCAAFSPGCNMLAVGYHGAPLSVWVIESATGPVRTSAKTLNTDRLIWNPVSRSLLGILHGGFLFKELPSNGEVRILDDISVDAVCSPDGRFVATTHSDGFLKLRRFDDLSVIHLFFESSICAGLTISLCGGKIYDIRDSFCYAWQVFSWDRQAESPENFLRCSTETPPSTISKMTSSKKMVSALSVCQITGNAVVGFTSGELQILGENSKLLASLKPSGLHITHAIWSENTCYLATADISASVSVRRFNRALNQLETVFEHLVETKILQLLFNKTSTLLLIVDNLFLTILSSHSGSLISRKPISSTGYLGVNHPRDNNLLLFFSPKKMRSFLWKNLEELEPRSLEHQSPLYQSDETSRWTTKPEVKKIWTSSSTSLIVVQFTAYGEHGLERAELFFVDSQSIASVTKESLL